MPSHGNIQAPDMPELEPVELTAVGIADGLRISGALLEQDGHAALVTRLVDIEESELQGVALAAAKMPGLQLSDVILRDCDFSNVHGRGGAITRTEIHRSRFVGFD